MICQIRGNKNKGSYIEMVGENLRCSEIHRNIKLIQHLFGDLSRITYQGFVYDYDEEEKLNLTDREYSVDGLSKSYLFIDDTIKCKPDRYRFNRVRLYLDRGDNFV